MGRIMRVAFFMENFLGPIGQLTATILRVGLKGDTKVNLVAVKDIGTVGAAVFRARSSYFYTSPFTV